MSGADETAADPDRPATPEPVGPWQGGEPSEDMEALQVEESGLVEESGPVEQVLNGSATKAFSATETTGLAPPAPLISLDEAKEKIGPALLEILDQNFKGKLEGVRHPDQRDHFF